MLAPQKNEQSRVRRFAAKARQLFQQFLPGAEVSFSEEERTLSVSGIRTQHGLYAANILCASLAEGMELNLSKIDFGLHPHP